MHQKSKLSTYLVNLSERNAYILINNSVKSFTLITRFKYTWRAFDENTRKCSIFPSSHQLLSWDLSVVAVWSVVEFKAKNIYFLAKCFRFYDHCWWFIADRLTPSKHEPIYSNPPDIHRKEIVEIFSAFTNNK